MSCRCFLNHSPLNKRVCQSIPILPTCFQLALLTQHAVIPHFNKVYVRFHWHWLKIFNLLCSDYFGNKHFHYHPLMNMCIDIKYHDASVHQWIVPPLLLNVCIYTCSQKFHWLLIVLYMGYPSSLIQQGT